MRAIQNKRLHPRASPVQRWWGVRILKKKVAQKKNATFNACSAVSYRAITTKSITGKSDFNKRVVNAQCGDSDCCEIGDSDVVECSYKCRSKEKLTTLAARMNAGDCAVCLADGLVGWLIGMGAQAALVTTWKWWLLLLMCYWCVLDWENVLSFSVGGENQHSLRCV